MSNVFRAVVVSLVSAASLTGCAAITASRAESLAVVSHPAGAQVRLNGVPAGVTPTRIEVPRKTPGALVEVELPGHRPEVCALNHSAGGGYVAADVVMCVLLFPIGCVAFVDADGSWNELTTPVCSVNLQPLESTEFSPTITDSAIAAGDSPEP